jgi:hypothetical protein
MIFKYGGASTLMLVATEKGKKIGQKLICSDPIAVMCCVNFDAKKGKKFGQNKGYTWFSNMVNDSATLHRLTIGMKYFVVGTIHSKECMKRILNFTTDKGHNQRCRPY